MNLFHWGNVYKSTIRKLQRKVLNLGDKPCAEFTLTDDDSVVAVYAYCNLHGLWKA